MDQMNFTITGKIRRTVMSVDRKVNCIVVYHIRLTVR